MIIIRNTHIGDTIALTPCTVYPASCNILQLHAFVKNMNMHVNINQFAAQGSFPCLMNYLNYGHLRNKRPINFLFENFYEFSSEKTLGTNCLIVTVMCEPGHLESESTPSPSNPNPPFFLESDPCFSGLNLNPSQKSLNQDFNSHITNVDR